MPCRLLLAIFAALAVAAAAIAQQRPAAEPKRGAYEVKHALAKDLAEVLARRFKDAEIQAGPPGAGNCLLVSAPPAVFDEVMKALDRLDRKPQSVAVEVFVVALPARKADTKEKGPDEKEFAGAIDDVATRLEAMRKKGEVTEVKRFHLATSEDQPGSLQVGAQKPFIRSITTRATGIVSRAIAYRDVGTRIRVTPQVGTDKVVMLELAVEDSRMVHPEGAPALGNDEKGNPIPPTDFLVTALDAKLSVASGKAVLAKEAKGTSKEGQGQTLIVVGARVVEPGAGGK